MGAAERTIVWFMLNSPPPPPKSKKTKNKYDTGVPRRRQMLKFFSFSNFIQFYTFMYVSFFLLFTYELIHFSVETEKETQPAWKITISFKIVFVSECVFFCRNHTHSCRIFFHSTSYYYKWFTLILRELSINTIFFCKKIEKNWNIFYPTMWVGEVEKTKWFHTHYNTCTMSSIYF